MLRGEAANAYFVFFGLTWSGFESVIYLTQGKHANHYTMWFIKLRSMFNLPSISNGLPKYLQTIKFSSRGTWSGWKERERICLIAIDNDYILKQKRLYCNSTLPLKSNWFKLLCSPTYKLINLIKYILTIFFPS